MPDGGPLRCDQLIRLTGTGAESKCPHLLRRVKIYDAEHQRTLVFLTNHLGLSAATIAAIYKDRWQIELFFKALKQNLKIKTFVGTTPNAVKTQVWTALIAMLILLYLQLKSTFAWSLSNLVALLPHESVYSPRPVGLAQRAIRNATRHAGHLRATRSGPRVIRTAPKA